MGNIRSSSASHLTAHDTNCFIFTGEQSVGKSFTLNHLADTSFAGSAMRTTEGVWMSLTPTDDDIIVTLDFEGKCFSIHRMCLLN